MTLIKICIGIIIGVFIASHNPELASQIQTITLETVYSIQKMVR
ncbi:hypothetical protein [Photobacterium pectinilyticum]|nr:hypothetical protein [Photobacterium sp. ZSDE20]